MEETKKQTSPSQKISSEAHPNEQKKELVILRGIATSQINQALKADKPYPARVFLRVEGYEQDIPVIFRIRCPQWKNCPNCHEWERPKIKVGSYLEVKGKFENPVNGSARKSFTAYSYTLLACPHSQKKPYHCPIDCSCLKGQDLRNKVLLEKSKARFPIDKP